MFVSRWKKMKEEMEEIYRAVDMVYWVGMDTYGR